MKPEIKQVALRPEEAVLGACKASSGAGGSGPGGGNCRTPGALQLARLVIRRACTSESPASRFRSPGRSGDSECSRRAAPRRGSWSSRSPPDVEIEVVAARSRARDGAGECLFDSGGTWRLHRARRRLSVSILFLDPRLLALQDRALQPRFLAPATSRCIGRSSRARRRSIRWNTRSTSCSSSAFSARAAASRSTDAASC